MSTVPPNDPSQPRYPPPRPKRLHRSSSSSRRPRPSAATASCCSSRWCIAVMTIIGQAASYRSYFSPPGGPQEKYHSLSEKRRQEDRDHQGRRRHPRPRGVRQAADRPRARGRRRGGRRAADRLARRHGHGERLSVPPSARAGRRSASCRSSSAWAACAPAAATTWRWPPATADDVIFAEPTTWTGSIGVLIPHYDLSGLLARWDVQRRLGRQPQGQAHGQPHARADARGARPKSASCCRSWSIAASSGSRRSCSSGRPKLKADDDDARQGDDRADLHVGAGAGAGAGRQDRLHRRRDRPRGGAGRARADVAAVRASTTSRPSSLEACCWAPTSRRCGPPGAVPTWRHAARPRRPRGRTTLHLAAVALLGQSLDERPPLPAPARRASTTRSPRGRPSASVPAYRVAQVRKWLFEKRAADWDAMTDLPKALRGELAERFRLWTTDDRQAHAGRRRHGEAAAGPRRRRADRVRAAARTRAPHDLHQHAGRLRHGLRVLRQRPRRRRPQSDRPARSSSRCCGCSGCSPDDPRTSGSATSS